MLSRPLIPAPQTGQVLGGDTIDLPAGTLKMTTFRKDPISEPNAPTKIAVTLAASQITIRDGGSGPRNRHDDGTSTRSEVITSDPHRVSRKN